MKEFKDELRALLAKYNATISFGCDPCSDLHGVCDERMEVSVVAPVRNQSRYEEKIVISVYGYSMDKSDF